MVTKSKAPVDDLYSVSEDGRAEIVDAFVCLSLEVSLTGRLRQTLQTAQTLKRVQFVKATILLIAF